MPRTTALLFALVALLSVGLVWVANRPALTEQQVQALLAAQPAPETDTEAVAAIVTALLDEQKAETPDQQVAAIDAETVNPLIEEYLLANPRILQRVSEALQAEARAEELEQTRLALAALDEVIYDDPDHIVLGNPQGDVTLVELFDYNCGYCRQAVPDLATLMAEDPNLRVILKEFPILSQASIDAAKVAVVVGRDKSVDYWAFHQKLFSSRGQVNKESALEAAAGLGLNPITLGLEMEGADIDSVIARSFQIAQGLNITGTPTYIIGDEVIPGAIGIDSLRQIIANIRECGSAYCSS